MDPMDYVLHNPPSLPPHADHVHGPPGNWMSHSHAHAQPHVSPPSHWASHPPVMPQHFHHQRSHHPGSHPFQQGQNGGFMLPDPNTRSYHLPDPLSGVPMQHHRPWNHHFPPMPGPATAVPPNHLGMSGSSSELPFGLLASAAGRNFPFQPPPGGDMGMGPPGATSESLPLPRSLFSPSAEHSVNALGQQTTASQFSVPPPHFNSSQSRRTGHHASSSSSASSSSTPRTPRSAIPPPSFVPLPHHHHHHHHHETQGLPSPTSDRRRSGHSRARRSMNARLNMSEFARESDDDVGDGVHDHSASGPGHRSSQSVGNIALDDPTIRQMQVLRGALTSKMVASTSALQSLQSIDIDDLPKNERTCVICYNDYGAETPEGISEAPLRLPKCKHVFGDHCIKKWFEDSDSCPYCRDKLHSEPKHHITSARAFMNIMRMRSLPQGMPEEMYVRLMAGLEGDLVDIAPRQPHAERRSLPDDAGDSQRRTRPRRSTRDAATSTGTDHSAPTAGPATGTAPIRIPSRETLRYPHWMVRSQTQRRATYVAPNQDTDAMGHHRQPGSHSRFPVGAAMTNMNVDMSLLNPLQAHRTDGPDGVNIASSSAGTESTTSQTRASVDPVPALADQNRSRPW